MLRSSLPGPEAAPSSRTAISSSRRASASIVKLSDTLDCVRLCVEAEVPTNLGIDEKLLEQALRAGGRRTKRETVNEALREYLQRRKRRDFVRLFGTIDFRPGWDYKKARRR